MSEQSASKQASLARRVGISVFGSIVAAVALVAMLTYLKSEDNLARIVESRNSFVAEVVKSRIQLGLGLGLELASLNNSQGIIDIAVTRDPGIQSIRVFNERGAIIFASGSDATQGMVPDEWQRLNTHGSPGDPWSIRDSASLVTGVRLTNNFGQVVGGLAISHSRQALNARTRAMLHDILINCSKVLAIAPVLAALAVILVLRPIRRGFDRSLASIMRFRGQPTDQGATFTAKSGLELAAAQFQERATSARACLADAERQLANMDV